MAINKHLRKGKQYLKQYQVDYIEENARQLSSRQLATAIGCSQGTIYWWCKKLKVTTTKECFQFRPPVIPECKEPEPITNSN